MRVAHTEGVAVAAAHACVDGKDVFEDGEGGGHDGVGWGGGGDTEGRGAVEVVVGCEGADEEAEDSNEGR